MCIIEGRKEPGLARSSPKQKMLVQDQKSAAIKAARSVHHGLQILYLEVCYSHPRHEAPVFTTQASSLCD
jgi:hypothetical protein